MDINNREYFRPLDSGDFERMNVGKRFWAASLDSIDDKYPYKKSLVDFINALGTNLCQGMGFLFWGEQSTGKTSAAVILAKAAVAFNHTYTELINRAYMLTTNDAVNIMWGGSWAAQDELVEIIDTVDLLILDDLGLDRENEAVAHEVENVVRRRLNAGRSLIVTTSLAQSKMSARYGPTFIKLLIDGGCYPLKFEHTWKSKNMRDMLKDGGTTHD